MNNKKLNYSLLIAILSLGAFGYFCYKQQRIPGDGQQLTITTTKPLSPAAKQSMDRLSILTRQLQNNELSEQEVYQEFIALEGYLQTLQPKDMRAIITNYLNSNIDAQTGFDFVLDPDGYLDLAPTLRTFLLDQLSASQPATAADYAYTILASSRSADEWAIALRSLAWNQPQAVIANDSYFTAKLHYLLNEKRWQSAPTAGYLNAFDAVVYHGDKEFVQDLCQLISQGSNRENAQAIRYAAYLSLDRMAQRNYTPIVTTLLENLNLLAKVPRVRAHIIARGDMRNQQHRKLLQSYLLNTNIAMEEKAILAQLFPNFNTIVSHNLLTRPPASSISDHLEQDRATLNIIDNMIFDPQFFPYRDLLAQVQKKLVVSLRSAARGELRSQRENFTFL